MPRQKKVKLIGLGLPANVLKEFIDLSYKGNTSISPAGYSIDAPLSDSRVKVYTKNGSKEVIVTHRGSVGLLDWMDNAKFFVAGKVKNTASYKLHRERHLKAIEKYGANNIIGIGHSRAGLYLQELQKEVPIKEIITYNKAVGFYDALRKNEDVQTDVKVKNDFVSLLSGLQKRKKPMVEIEATKNPFDFNKAHQAEEISKLGETFIGKKEEEEPMQGSGTAPKTKTEAELKKLLTKLEKQRANIKNGKEYKTTNIDKVNYAISYTEARLLNYATKGMDLIITKKKKYGDEVPRKAKAYNSKPKKEKPKPKPEPEPEPKKKEPKKPKRSNVAYNPDTIHKLTMKQLLEMKEDYIEYAEEGEKYEEENFLGIVEDISTEIERRKKLKLTPKNVKTTKKEPKPEPPKLERQIPFMIGYKEPKPEPKPEPKKEEPKPKKPKKEEPKKEEPKHEASKYKYIDILREQNTASFPIAVFQSKELKSWVDWLSKLIEKMKKKEGRIRRTDIFFTPESKKFINEFFEYMITEKNGNVKIAILFLDDNIEELLKYLDFEDSYAGLNDYEKALNIKNAKILNEAYKKTYKDIAEADRAYEKAGLTKEEKLKKIEEAQEKKEAETYRGTKKKEPKKEEPKPKPPKLEKQSPFMLGYKEPKAKEVKAEEVKAEPKPREVKTIIELNKMTKAELITYYEKIREPFLTNSLKSYTKKDLIFHIQNREKEMKEGTYTAKPAKKTIDELMQELEYIILNKDADDITEVFKSIGFSGVTLSNLYSRQRVIDIIKQMYASKSKNQKAFNIEAFLTRFNKENCEDLMCKYGINSKSEFRKWVVKNHPDKGGTIDDSDFKQIIKCAVKEKFCTKKMEGGIFGWSDEEKEAKKARREAKRAERQAKFDARKKSHNMTMGELIVGLNAIKKKKAKKGAIEATKAEPEPEPEPEPEAEPEAEPIEGGIFGWSDKEKADKAERKMLREEYYKKHNRQQNANYTFDKKARDKWKKEFYAKNTFKKADDTSPKAPEEAEQQGIDETEQTMQGSGYYYLNEISKPTNPIFKYKRTYEIPTFIDPETEFLLIGGGFTDMLGMNCNKEDGTCFNPVWERRKIRSQILSEYKIWYNPFAPPAPGTIRMAWLNPMIEERFKPIYDEFVARRNVNVGLPADASRDRFAQQMFSNITDGLSYIPGSNIATAGLTLASTLSDTK